MSKGSVIKRGNSWLLKYDAGRDPATGKRRQCYKTVKDCTKAEAQIVLRSLMADVDNKTHVDRDKKTFKEWATSWLEDDAKPNVGAKTYERYSELLLHHAFPMIGAIKLQDLRSEDIKKLYTKMRTSGHRVVRKDKDGKALPPRGLSESTILQLHWVLSKCLKAAIEVNKIRVSPLQSVKSPRKSKAQKVVTSVNVEESAFGRALEQDQLARLLNGIKGKSIFLVSALAAGTGLRRGEVLALRWSDINFETFNIIVQRTLEETRAGGVVIKNGAKSKSGVRSIKLDSDLIDLLGAEWKVQAEARLKLGEQLKRDALVFSASPETPYLPRNPSWLTRGFSRSAKALGFSTLRFHDLRHTHATLLLLAGVPVNAVAQRLGHASPAMTMEVYAHVLQRAEDRAAEVSGDMLRGVLSKMGK